MNNVQVKEMLLAVSDKAITNQELLCKLDSHVGDGDHGVTVSRGFRAVIEALSSTNDLSISELFTLTGKTLSKSMGGAIGPIFGSIFTSMGETDVEMLDTANIADMFAVGLESVMLIGGAKPGDRTLIDALDPAVSSLKEDTKSNLALKTALQNAATAAKKGAEGTKDMIAKKGRAKFLQEKSLGYQDAGATSMQLVLEAMADYAINQ